MTRKRIAGKSKSLTASTTYGEVSENGAITEATGTGGSGDHSTIPKQASSLCAKCMSFMKYIILLLLVPPFLNYAALNAEYSHLQGPGLLYDIGHGQKMYLSCNGTGVPTVILDAPTGHSSEVWGLVQPELAKLTKVCVYDRAGLGLSERPYRNYTPSESGEEQTLNRWHEFTVERMVDDLHKLVTLSSQQAKPFILVGSELGALVARFYTQMNEGDVSDLVLIDPLVENIFEQDAGIWEQFWYQHLLPSFQSMQLSAATGLTRIAFLIHLMEPPISGELVPEDMVHRQKHMLCNPRHLSSVVDEHYFINETFSQMKTISMLKPFPSNVSITVITGNYYDEQLPGTLNKAWAKSQQHLMSKLHPHSNHIVVNGADHRVLYKNPDAIIQPIKRLIRQWKNKHLKAFSR